MAARLFGPHASQYIDLTMNDNTEESRSSHVDLTMHEDDSVEDSLLPFANASMSAEDADRYISRLCVVDDEDEQDVEEIENELSGKIEFIDLGDEDNDLEFLISHPRPKPRAEPGGIVENRVRIATFQWGGCKLEPGVCVEIEHEMGQYTAQFLRVESIFQDPLGTNQTTLRGLAFARNRSFRGLFPRDQNECVMLVQVDKQDARKLPEQALVEISVEAIHGVRKSGIRITNTDDKAGKQNPNRASCRFDAEEYKLKGKDWIDKNGVLACSRKHIRYYNDQSKKRLDKVRETAIINITELEADCQFRIKDEANLNHWRGGKNPGGAYVPSETGPQAGGVIVSIDEADQGKTKGNGNQNGSFLKKPQPGQKYTSGDCFSGCGGVSRGMTRAGVKPVFAVDHWEDAVNSYQLNFPGVNMHCKDVHDFLLEKHAQRDTQVDIMHISPPCQPYSSAHTRDGKNDEANQGALFSCACLIKKCKPRVFTLEQTFGLLALGKNLQFFTALVHSFLVTGYSVRWSNLHLEEFGLPQPRRRLIIIGAGPGESLPTFPSPTHSNNPARGLKPLATAKKCLSRLPERLPPLHCPEERLYARDYVKVPWDPNRVLQKTITCGGGSNYHWCGKRDFTALEYALLQGFPANHRFGSTRITTLKRQIGNAFAPVVVSELYKHIVKWLLREDGFDGDCFYNGSVNQQVVLDGINTQGRKQMSSGTAGKEVYEVDDEDEEEVQFLGGFKAGPRRSFRG